MKTYRGIKIGYTVASGQDVLEKGSELARWLWNHLWWCQIGYNQKLMRQREGKVLHTKTSADGEPYSYYGIDYALASRNLPHRRGVKYLGNFGMQKEVKDHPAAVGLSDRCFTYAVKDFDIAMKSWFSNVKSRPRMRPPKYSREPRMLTFEIGRNAKHLGNFHFRLTVLGGRGSGRHAFIKLMPPPHVKLTDCKTFKLHPDGRCSLVVSREAAPASDGDGVAGIDLGITNIATVAFSTGESIVYSGRGIKSIDRHYHRKVAKTRGAEWQSGRRHEKQSPRAGKLRAKHANIRALVIHNLTTDIVEQCAKRDVSLIVIGELKGIRDGKDYGKRMNQQLHAWPFRKICDRIKYKAKERGITVKFVSEAYTSQTCCCCGTIRKANRERRGLYTCRDCGISLNADVNGAFNILNKKVSPGGFLPLGVGANFPSPPSPHTSGRIGKDGVSQIQPTFVAKFDLRNDYAVRHAMC